MNLLIYVLIILFGLIFGSFFCCMGMRIPNKISLIKPNSYCPNCKKELKWYMNIPVFSYLFLKGKCAYCKEQISLIYPLIEMFTSILFVIAYVTYGFSETFLILIILSSAFIVTIVSDLLYYYISDRVIVISLMLILTIKYIYGGLESLTTALIAVIGIFILMLTIKFLGDKMFKKESLGGGDVKLMTLAGASIGIIPSMINIVISSFICLPFALITLKNKTMDIVPFGPFLLFGTLLMIYFKEPINEILIQIGWMI